MNLWKRLFRPRVRSLDDPIQKVSQMLMMTQVEEIDCEATGALMHQYAEMVARGDDAMQLLPLVHRHIEMCPDCREELEALLRAMKA